VAISDLGFGVELECYLPEGRTMQEAATAVAARGIACHAEGYNHALRSTWKIVPDGSLQSSRGIELVSPILRGDAGLAQVEQVCEALQDFGCTVNRNCGFHVHVGVGRNAPLDFFKTITKLYGLFEPVIDGMMPTSRRASNNPFCRSMTSASPTAIDRATGLIDLIRIATGGQERSRYYKLNLHAHARHGTVEFRQHSGTIDARKTRMWTVLCLRMVDAALRGVSLRTAPAHQAGNPLAEMLLRPEGITRSDIVRSTGIPSVSVPKQLRACGVPFTEQRTGREIRYFAQNAAPPVPVTVGGFCDVICATQAEREYVETRTCNLSSPVPWAA
jgi:hypothetical protein